MADSSRASALILGVCIFAGLAALGYLGGSAALDIKQFERSVTVKGLSEREYDADIVIWPIQFTSASNKLEELYGGLAVSAEKIRAFLILNGIAPEAISQGAPAITDKSAQQYSNSSGAEFRYVANQSVTVYSADIATVRRVMGALADLGKQGIAISGENYMGQTEYLFTRLNEVKPEMVEEATRNARAVAEKFAEDSGSRLGKIRQASQGQFTISDRDRNNPHIKKVRVVSTVEYYLSD